MVQPQPENEPEIQFPIAHDKCPVCGSTRRVANEVRKREVAKGKIRPEANFAIGVYRCAITDPARNVLTCPLIISMLDVCANCGAVWSPMTQCTEQSVTQERPPLTRPPQGNRHTPFFSGG
jgi:hypothetical protein